MGSDDGGVSQRGRLARDRRRRVDVWGRGMSDGLNAKARGAQRGGWGRVRVSQSQYRYKVGGSINTTVFTKLSGIRYNGAQTTI